MVHLTTTPTMPNLTGTFVENGRLLLVKVVGSGSWGTVYRAVDTTADKAKGETTDYAVKCLAKSKDPRQALEFSLHRIASRHPNVVTLHRVFEQGEYLFMVLDLCTDGDLFAKIMEQHAYHNDAELVKRDFTQLLDAVEWCHSNSIYHRDLKPENVLVHNGSIQLADFGLADTKRVSRNFGVGSRSYMSPECSGTVLPFSCYSSRHSDIWSLGVILLNMITARAPWRQAVCEDDSFANYLDDPNYLMDVLPISRECSDLLARVFCLNPLSRASIRQFREGLLAIDTFWLSKEELEAAAPQVRAAAVWPSTKDKHSANASSSSSSSSIFSDDSGEALPKAYLRESSPARSLSSSSSSGDESDGPITPETHPLAVVDDELEVAALDALDISDHTPISDYTTTTTTKPSAGAAKPTIVDEALPRATIRRVRAL